MSASDAGRAPSWWRRAVPGWLEFLVAVIAGGICLYSGYKQSGLFFAAAPLLLIAAGTSLIMLLLGLAKWIFRRTRAACMVRPSLYLAGCILIFLAFSFMPKEDTRLQTTIVQLLTAYHARHGTYPEALGAAMGGDGGLDASTIGAHSIEYHREPGGVAFTVTYWSGRVRWSYDSRAAQWRASD